MDTMVGGQLFVGVDLMRSDGLMGLEAGPCRDEVSSKCPRPDFPAGWDGL